MIDIGVNLFSSQFDGEHDELLTQAYEAGVRALLITGTSVTNSRQAQQFCHRLTDQVNHSKPLCFATAGVHPHHAQEVSKGWLQALENLAQQPEVVAMGEMGLDYFRNFSDQSAQKRCFAAQVSLAADSGLPLFVHDRDASTDTLKILEQELLSSGYSDLGRVVVHCFTGTATALEAYLEAGCSIGITGWVSDKRRGEGLRQLVPKIPLTRLLIETDAPYLRPHNAPQAKARNNKRRNTPALLGYVARSVAELLDMNEAEVQKHSSDNAKRLFNLPAAAAATATPVVL